MTALTRFFFRSPYRHQSSMDVIRWWESRRLTYNMAVGAAGTLTLSTIIAIELLLGNGIMGFPWQPIVAYAVLANICYSFGPLVDMYICRKWGNQYEAIGPAIFRYGFVFSVGLTLLPIPMILLSGVVRMLKVVI
jgi:hypothetical protein